MKRARLVLACSIFASSAMATAVACSVEDASNFEDDGNGSPTSGAPDARASGSDGGAPMSTMRLAHLAPDLGPLDFCYRAARVGSFEGPVLRGPTTPSNEGGTGDPSAEPDADGGDIEAGADRDAEGHVDVDAEAGASSPLGYRSVSKYFTLAAAGTLTIAVVEAGATSCAAPLATGGVTLDPGKLATVGLLGSKDQDGGAELTLVSFTDDRSTVDDMARVRVVHAALGLEGATSPPSIAVRVAASGTTVLAERVPPRGVSVASQNVPVDGLGYATVPPVPSPATLVIGPAPSTGGDGSSDFTTWLSEAQDLDLRPSSLHTAFVLGRPGGGFEVVWCSDRTTRGSRTNCDLLR